VTDGATTETSGGTGATIAEVHRAAAGVIRTLAAIGRGEPGALKAFLGQALPGLALDLAREAFDRHALTAQALPGDDVVVISADERAAAREGIARTIEAVDREAARLFLRAIIGPAQPLEEHLGTLPPRLREYQALADVAERLTDRPVVRTLVATIIPDVERLRRHLAQMNRDIERRLRALADEG